MLSLVFGLVGGLLVLVLLLVVGLPLALLLGFAPLVLALMGVVLLIKGILEKPTTLENLKPALIAFVAAILLNWIF